MTVLTKTDVYASFYTLSGASAAEPSRYSLPERVDAAAAAGITGIGMSVQDYAYLTSKHTPSELRTVLDDGGVALYDVEFLWGWELSDVQQRSRDYEQRLLEMAHALGASQLNVGILDQPESLVSTAELAHRFRSLCERASEADLTVALEPLALSHFRHVTQADEVVSQARADNGGILLDAYHFFRSADSLQTLATITPSHIKAVQISDAPRRMPADLLDECVSHRQLPGEGQLPLVELLTTLHEMGVEAPLAVEVMSSDLQRLTATEAASRAADAVANIRHRSKNA
jgi:sugar phosphate isomerase/epimerase